MPLGVAAHLSEEDEAALEALRDPNEEPLDAGDGAPGEQPTDKPVPTPAPTEPKAEQPKEPEKEPGAEQPQADKPQGDLRKALRAARQAERRTERENERLREENDRLKQLAESQPQPPADDDLPDADIAAAAADFPVLGKLAKVVKKIASQVSKQPDPPARADQSPDNTGTEFVPIVLDPAVQEAVDSVPALLDWQHDPDQTRFRLAARVEGVLAEHPKWKDKPLEERYAEVVRRVQAELGQTPAPPTTKPAIDPQKAIADAPARKPSSLGDIGGGDMGRDKGNDLARFKSMSEEEILAELHARG